MKTYEQFINESNNHKSFYDFNAGTFINDKLILKLTKDESLNMLLDNYIDDNNINEDILKTKNSKDFKKYTKIYLSDLFDDAKYNIEKSIKNDKLKIYRAMYVNDSFEENLNRTNHLGVYWSWNKEGAYAHNSDYNRGKNSLIIEAIIDINNINWNLTFYQNIHPAFCDEDEIRTFKNIEIEVLSMIFNDYELLDSNRKFYT